MTSTSIKIGVFVLFATILIFQTAVTSAQSAIPENAYTTNSSYGKKWKCLLGFREQRNTCTEISVPDNAYLRSSGDGWECNRGYQKRNNQCVNIDVPKNAFLTGRTYGAGWECERGFMADNKGCNKITIPDNAYLSETGYGTGWKCDRGFEAKGKGANPSKYLRTRTSAIPAMTGNARNRIAVSARCVRRSRFFLTPPF